MPAYNFNAQQFEPEYGGGLAQFPPSKKLKVVIIGSELKPTAKGNGGYLQFIMKCIEGPMMGREGFDNLNLNNINAKTVEIANKQLSAYCHVTGQYVIQATEQFYNIPFLVDVDWQKGNEPTQEKPEGGYTQITAIYDVHGNAPGKAGQARPAAAVAPAAPPAGVAPAAPPANGWGPPAPAATPAPVNNGWPAATPPAAAWQPQPNGGGAPQNNWNNR